MTLKSNIGRTIGIALLVQMATALILPFVLIGSIVKGYPDYLESAAAASGQVRLGIVVGFVGMAFTLYLGVSMFPILKEHSRRAALWFLAVCVVSCTLDLVHNGTVLSMLSASERFAAAGGRDDAIYRAWGITAASMRRSVHVMQLVAIAAWMMSFYVANCRFRLTPRLFSVLGIGGVASQFTGVTAMMLLGYPTIGFLAMILAPIHAATAIWLIVKGFPRNSTSAGKEQLPNYVAHE
ncbi:MAG: DUF4386 domain-containing protein [Pyrinomonadaceae bacterium]